MAPYLSIVSRKEWGADAEAESHAVPLMTPVKHILRTFTDTDPCYSREECIRALKELQADHMAEGQSDIKYNFLIGGDGTIYEGRGWERMPYLNFNYPRLLETCIEVAHFGHSGIPPIIAMSTTENLIALGVERNYIMKKFRLVMSFEDIEEPADSECQKELVDPDTLMRDVRNRPVTFS